MIDWLVVNCPYIANEGKAEWDEILANGQPINGTCINGYNGIITRNCIQSGSNGNWGSISGSCHGISFFLSFLLFLPKLKTNKWIDINECLENNGGCNVNANCTNIPGSYECHCKPGYIGNGIECSPCNENEYSFNETTCLSCPQNTTSELASSSITDCECDLFNHYLDIENLICLPCDFGFLLDEISNTCQSNFYLFICLFKKIIINQ